MELKTHVLLSFLIALTTGLTVCSSLTPQYIYLEMMRNRLQLAATTASSPISQTSALLASAPALSTITGLSSDGFFNLSVRNSLELTTPCSALKSKQFKPIYSSKLFLFPKLDSSDVDSKEKASYDVTFSVTISSDLSSNAVTRNVMATWDKDPRKSCMELDIMRVIKKYNMMQSELDDHNKECTISVVVDKVTEVEDDEQTEDKVSIYYSVFGNKTCSTPFLFLTHVRGILEEDEEDGVDDVDSTNDHRPARAILSKRYAATDRNTTTEPAVSICGIKELDIELTEMLPIKIMAPKSANIRVCQGLCPSVNSFREVIISQVSKNNPELGLSSTPCCTPTSFEPLIVLIEEEQDMRIVSIEDSIVASCGCII